MRRKDRPLARLARSLTLGLVLATSAGLSVAGTGCRDEDDPLTHVEDLKDATKQPMAIKRIDQFYQDAMARDKKDRGGPTVKPLLEKVVEPLTKVCLDPAVKDRTRAQLVKMLADMRDARAEPCFKKTLEDYKPDTTEDDVVNVLRAVIAMKSKGLATEVIKVYQTLEFSRPKAKLIGKDVTNAVLAVIDASHEDVFLKALEKPWDPSNQQAMQNEAFWQTVAARALGELKSEKAAKPLLQVILTPSKGPIGSTALVAMVKIGKPSIKAAEGVLNGSDAELVKFSTGEQLKGAQKDTNGKINEKDQKLAEKAHISVAAEVLGALGAEGSIAPLLAAKDKTEDPATKVIISLVLTQLPRNEGALASFKKVYEDAKLDLDTPAGPAKEIMVERASDFFDPTVAPWLVKTSLELKGDPAEKGADIDPIRALAFVTATKLMTEEQLAEVQTLADAKTVIEGEGGKKVDSQIGKAFEKEFKQAKELVTKCKANIDCYVTELTLDANQGKDKQFTAIKAAYMIGLLGKEGDRAKIVDALPKIENPLVRGTALKALEALSPKGDPAIADKLDAFFDKAEESKDEKAISETRIYVQAAARLRSRAQ
jgi:hypothetical protein